jgi:hypothetical protein
MDHSCFVPVRSRGMETDRDARARHAPADLPVEAIRLAINIAQSECVCMLHLSVCLLTDAGERAGFQPFLYESGVPA